MSEKGYGHYEAGRREPTPSTLSRLAEILTVPVSYFFSDEDMEGPVKNAYYEGLPSSDRAVADEVIRSLWLKHQRDQTTHGKKAE